jgi:alpha-1,2-mannosyltransferase
MVPETDSGYSNFDPRVIVAIIFVLLYVPLVVNYGIGYRNAAQVDLESFYWASAVTFEQGESPYGPEAFAGIQSVWEETVNPYWYPPPSLLAFYPLSWFSYDVARIATLVINHLLLLVFLWLLIFRVLKLRWRTPDVPLIIVTLALALTYYPINSTIYHGQVNLAVGICVLLFWVGVRDNHRPALVAIPLAIAIVLKSYPIAFLALLLYQNKHRAVFWTLGCLSVAVLIAWLVLPAVVWSDWWFNVLPGGGYGVTVDAAMPPAGPWNQSLNGFCARLFLGGPHSAALIPSPVLARLVPYLLSLAIVGVSVWHAVRRREGQTNPVDVDWQISMFLVILYLVAPFSWEHHGVFILPAILIGFKRLLPVWRSRMVVGMILLFSAGVLAWYLPFQSPRLTTGLPTLLISIKLYAALGLWLTLLLIARTQFRSQKTTPA